MTIAEFLAARLDEDEQTASAVTPGPWGAQPPEDQSTWDGGWEVVSDAYRPDQLGHQVVNVGDSDPTGIITQRGGVVDEEHARYIARHDPDRMLREIEAKRAILAEYEEALQTQAGFSETREEIGRREALHMAVSALAAVYADRHDYRQEWTP